MKSKITILQLKESNETRNLMFASLDFVKRMGMEVNLENYKPVYEYEQETPSEDELDSIYARFQGSKPEGYTGHSISVADIIKIDDKCFYVDSFGFEQI